MSTFQKKVTNKLAVPYNALPTELQIDSTDKIRVQSHGGTRMFFKTGYDHGALAAMWQVSRPSISRYCIEWVPKWGKIAALMTHLPCSPEFLAGQQPSGLDV